MTTTTNPRPDGDDRAADSLGPTEHKLSKKPRLEGLGLVRCDNCGRHGWHETDRCPESRPDVPPPAGFDAADEWAARGSRDSVASRLPWPPMNGSPAESCRRTRRAPGA